MARQEAHHAVSFARRFTKDSNCSKGHSWQQLVQWRWPSLAAASAAALFLFLLDFFTESLHPWHVLNFGPASRLQDFLEHTFGILINILVKSRGVKPLL
jgi:hypothetical protein